MEHLAELVEGEWALWRCVGVRAAGFPVSGLDAFGGTEERDALAAIAADPRFREAVLWQNPAALVNAIDKVAAASPAGGSTQRQRLEIIASYWQRYCSKERHDRFLRADGVGAVRRRRRAIALVQPGPQLLAARTVRFEVWVIEALAEALGADFVVPVCPHPERELRRHLAQTGDAAGLAALDELEAARDNVAAACGSPRCCRRPSSAGCPAPPATATRASLGSRRWI